MHRIRKHELPSLAVYLQKRLPTIIYLDLY